MKIGPKYKICKRLGSGVFEKCQTQKFQLSEAKSRKNTKRRRGLSDYGKQLLEKQKVRFSYGLTEKQLRRYVDEALNATDTVKALGTTLEMRLDNVVYLAGLAQTRRMARQIVSHGHMQVNGRKIKIPSYIVKIDDEITVRDGSKQKPVFTNLKKTVKAPSWLDVDLKKLNIKVKNTPKDMDLVNMFDFQSVFEFYSR